MGFAIEQRVVGLDYFGARYFSGAQKSGNPGTVHAIADSIGGYADTFDAESRLSSSTLNSITTTYASDGEGHRVQKTTSGVTRTYVYNVGGELVAEYTNSTASSNLTCAVCYPAADNLGSTRLITAGGTGQVVKRIDFLPFVRIPGDADQRSGLMPIAIPK